MATAFQEQDGSGSMRRTLAFLYALISFEQANLAAIYNNQWAFFGACLCAGMVLLLMGMTTVEGLAVLVKSIRNKE